MPKFNYFLLAFLFVIQGCISAPIRTNPQFKNYFQGEGVEKTITVMPIDIKFYKLTSGNIPEEMDEWDRQSDALFEKAITEKLDPLAKIRINMFQQNGLDDKWKDFIAEQNGLYRAVAQSIIVYSGFFPEKKKNFDYTLGSDISRIDEISKTDALLFFNGLRSYWTGGRIMMALWGIAIGAVTGVTYTPGHVPDWLSVSLVDAKTGDVLWYRYYGPPTETVGDLREAQTVTKTVAYLFKDFAK